MAEATSGAGGTSLEGERGKRPPPEGEPAAPASGVLDKLFGKRLLQVGRYLVSHKAWMKTVPTENCDVLMTFPDTTDDHTLLWLLNHIRVGIPELIVQVRHHRHTRAYAFFVTATYESLLRGADELGLRKAVKAEFGGGTRGFSCEEDFIYENVESELRFFTSQERQSIIRFWLQNLRAKQGEALHNVRFLEDQPIIPELAARGIIQQVFPVHEQRILNRLMKSWVQAVCENQPLDEICDYFGVKIAMYFAWLGFYTSAMVYPAVFGSVLYTFTEADQTSRDVSCVVFALFNVVWSTLFLEEWKRRGAELAYKWGTLDSPGEAVEEPRPQFRGVRRISPVTQAEEFYYPPWKRLLFQMLVSLPLCLTCLACVFLLMLGCFQLQELVLSVKGLPRLARFLPKVMLALLVSASAEGYKKLAVWLNDMENYRLESAYEKHLIIKVVLFQFVNSYLSLFYIGFYLKDMERLKEMLATLLITRQFLQNVREVLQPHLYRRLGRGELGLRAAWELARALLGLLSLRRPTRGHLEPPAEEGGGGSSSGGGRRCLSGGCGAPEEEEEATVERRPAGEGGEVGDGPRGGREEEDEEEEEDDEEEEEEEEEGEEGGLLDCGLRLKKVSFAERGAGRRRPGPSQEALLEEGSPTMVEKGLEPGVFTLAEEDDEAEGAPSSPEREPPPAVLLRRAGGEGRDQGPDGGLDPEPGSGDSARKQRRQNRSSWIDPPEEEHSSQLTQAELESCMKKYEDTFQDYQEMFVQFGYVVLFSSAFPLAALCALINNLIEIRSDALKLCTGLQRPFGQRVESIGQWQKVMEVMGVLAIVVNCYLIGQCGQLQRLFPWLSPEAAIVSVVVLEHFALLLKYLIHVAIPDIPGWVAEEMAKLEYQRREAFKESPGVGPGLGGHLLTHSLLPVPVMAPFCHQRHERQAQHRYQQQQRRRREEEERQRHAEHHARRERDASGREEARAEGSGLDPAAPEKTSAKAKGSGAGGHGPERPKRPGSLLAPNNVMKLKQIIPLQGKFLSSGASSSSPAGPGANLTTRPTPAQSPTGSDTRLPAFLSFKFLKSPETRRDPERSHSPPKAFHAGKLFPFGGARAEAGSNGAGGQARQDGTLGGGGCRAQRSGLADEAAAEEPDTPRPEEEGSGTALAPVGAPALRTRRSRSPAPPPPPPTPLPRPPTPPAGCWQWDGPWGCGGEGAAPRQAPAANDCPPCALAGPPPAPQPLPGDASFYSLPLPPLPPTSEPPQPPMPSPSPSSSPSPQAVCWPSGWH
ncbi:anoctamin-8 isoform X3 [Cervus elaphus]|uniref:anoctamin-8 isoform X3 n=1 Tax=Cervus canadensis TaxID=1574408 RepID=UPI001C9E37FA|nr:anoctamin-8 isoform X3 [Cervus canadensis]XP_043766977.1 anoctamin-8 isoform X3 [Cervus elaphus]